MRSQTSGHPKGPVVLGRNGKVYRLGQEASEWPGKTLEAG